MDISSDPDATLFERIESLLKDSEPNSVSVLTSDGKIYRIFAQVLLGSDFLEFQPESADQKLLVLPLKKILRLIF